MPSSLSISTNIERSCGAECLSAHSVHSSSLGSRCTSTVNHYRSARNSLTMKSLVQFLLRAVLFILMGGKDGQQHKCMAFEISSVETARNSTGKSNNVIASQIQPALHQYSAFSSKLQNPAFSPSPNTSSKWSFFAMIATGRRNTSKVSSPALI